MEGNLVNCLDDFADIATGSADVLHRLHQRAHALSAPFCRLLGFSRQMIGLVGVFRALPDLGRHLVHGRRDFFQSTGLLRRTLREGLARIGDLVGAVGDLFPGELNLGDDLIETMGHHLQSLAQLILVGYGQDLDVEVAFGNLFGQSSVFFQIAGEQVEVLDQMANFVAALEIELHRQVA